MNPVLLKETDQKFFAEQYPGTVSTKQTPSKMSASMKLTQATEEQQKDVAAMINKMINPIVKPVDLSFTLGWDVVASYSEGHINKLLEARHASDQGQML